jgi:hypothetical protein
VTGGIASALSPLESAVMTVLNDAVRSLPAHEVSARLHLTSENTTPLRRTHDPESQHEIPALPTGADPSARLAKHRPRLPGQAPRRAAEVPDGAGTAAEARYGVSEPTSAVARLTRLHEPAPYPCRRPPRREATLPCSVQRTPLAAARSGWARRPPSRRGPWRARRRSSQPSPPANSAAAGMPAASLTTAARPAEHKR